MVVGSVISYFCTMVTACAILMATMIHLVPPPMFQQPRPVVVSRHSHIAVERSTPSGAQSLGHSIACDGNCGGVAGTSKGEASAISTATSVAQGTFA
jgi:hypothetical protein